MRWRVLLFIAVLLCCAGADRIWPRWSLLVFVAACGSYLVIVWPAIGARP